jgi:predicted nucleotidyltransferase
VFESLLALLARELDHAGIAYMVIGGQAVQFYGEARMTQDIDITLGIGTEGLARVMDVCRACGLSIRTDTPEEFVRDTMVLPAVEEKTGIRVDFIFSLSDYEWQAIERGRLVELGGTKVRFAALEDLIIHKLVAERPHHPRQEPGLRPGLHRSLAPPVRPDPEPRHLLNPPPPASGVASAPVY